MLTANHNHGASLHDERVRHLDAVRLHGVTIAIMIIANVRVEKVAYPFLALAGDGEHDGHDWERVRIRKWMGEEESTAFVAQLKVEKDSDDMYGMDGVGKYRPMNGSRTQSALRR